MCVRPHLGSNKRPFTATKHRLCHTCSLSEVCEAACVFCLRPLLMNKWMQTTSVICFNLPLWSFTTTRWILRRSENNQTEKTTYGVWQQRTFRAHYLHVFIMLKYFILLARRAGCSYDTRHNMIPVESHFPTANTASRLSAPPDSLRGNKKKHVSESSEIICLFLCVSVSSQSHDLPSWHFIWLKFVCDSLLPPPGCWGFLWPRRIFWCLTKQDDKDSSNLITQKDSAQSQESQILAGEKKKCVDCHEVFDREIKQLFMIAPMTWVQVYKSTHEV